MGDVSNLFDRWLIAEKELPTVNDILHMAKPREFHKALAAPRNEEIAKDGLKKIEQVVAAGMKKQVDMKRWARKIIANPSNYPDISFKYATEALKASE